MSAVSRLLLFSQRRMRPNLSRCFPYEFEDTIQRLEQADMVAPEFRFRQGERIDAYTNTIGRYTELVKHLNLAVRTHRVQHDYELFLSVCQFATDLIALQALQGWRDRCRVAVCWLEEVWARDLPKLRSQLSILKDFDYIFTNCSNSVQGLAELTQRPCFYAPPAVDCLRFFPGIPPVERCIDVYNMGRRATETHQALLDLAQSGKIFYLYDTFRGNVPVQDPAEHRLLLASIIKRSRYFLANKAKVDATGDRGVQEEVGFRFFEGAAAGSVMIGDPPEVDAFREHFDWRDAVVPLPFASTEIGTLVTELDGQPERVARIRRDNVVNALRRHDWVYRWRTIVETAGLEPTSAMRDRQAQLEQLATAFGDSA